VPDRRTFLRASSALTAGLTLEWLSPRSASPLVFQEAPAPGQAGRIDLRFRQIHLDFHTSEQIPEVGRDFDPERFAATLKRAAVNSVTCFGRCHHGYIYYDTAKFP
jgi:hypothetical protein